LRVSYVGELGWELHTPMAELEKVYDAVWAAGEDYGIADFGSYAVNNMRMEKAYAGWGSELTTEITMVEAGMRRFVSYKKGDFVGRDALLKKKEEGIDIKLVYMEMDVDDCDPHGNEAIFDGDKAIGIVTSGGYGYRCGKSLAFGYIEADNNSETLDVQILGKKYSAKVITEPAYDPKNERLKAVS